MKRIFFTFYMAIIALQVFAQQSIHGKITDKETGASIPGATITITGTTTATQSNINGVFELNSATPIAAVTISYIGYETLQLKVGTDVHFINIRLTTNSINLNTVTVTGYESNRRLLETAGAVALLTSRDIQRNNKSDLLPILNTVPGVKMEEEAPGDFKISLRGSALRDPYGLRNIKLYWNDIPLTSPDNSASHSLSVDPEQIGSIEIIKGPAGSIYGAGTGGVVLLKNDKPQFDENSLNAGFTGGSFGLARSSITYKTGSNNFNLSANYVHQTYNGYRQNEWSNKDAINVFGQFYDGPKRTITVIANHDEGNFGIAGSVDSTWAINTPKKAVQFTIDNKIGVNKYTYTVAGIAQDYKFSDVFTNTTSIYTDNQTLNHPYGQSIYYNGFLKSSTGGYGGRTRFSFSPKIGNVQTRFTIGDEVQVENLLNGTYNVTNDVPGTWPEPGALQSSNQITSKSNILFAQAEFDLPASFLLTLGSSINNLSYNVTDLIPQSATHNNYTGVVNFSSTISPRVALVKLFGKNVAAHASVSYGFSPPTISEVNNGDGTFNKTLNAEKGVNYELGLRGTILNETLNFDASVYQMDLNNAILPYYLANGRSNYRNAGATKQKGLELSLSYLAIHDANRAITLLKPWITYAYSDYRFKNYIEESYISNTMTTIQTDNSGKKVTGVSPNMFNAGIDLETKPGIYFNAVLNYISKTPINDKNTYYQHAYTLLASKLGYHIPIGQFGLDVFGGVNNMLNAKYSSWINFNADASSNPPTFYNPSSGINFYGGVMLKYNFK
ncbi:TonB-dependent receptor plug domain-containing protein [Mucilaginibacter sp.]|uniref:TonB-dependent receptor plug domain-containing protein n=1 Tax=Mucilaginibacter sp. TaxID=1882438 RepID=UPI00260D0848|nr:TonB-dependent receptor plug domain-containing protein [Mucilaginibacter sp.]MDB4926879.1 TonB-dependent receptor [Mucilaginibacter sp.]